MAAEQAAKRSNGVMSSEEALSHMTHVEQIVARTWNTLLGEDIVQSNTDNFFEMGGHSLLVSRMVNMLRDDFPTVAAKDVYSSSTLADLANLLETLAPQQVRARGKE